PLNMRYAQYHRQKNGRRGPLFMDRYKSIVTQDQNYIQELVRYVHLNPIRAGACKNLQELERYPWCGHSALSGGKKRAFQDTKTVLARFGPTENTAKASYHRFLKDGLAKSIDSDVIIDLVRKSNTGLEKGRKATCWVIGDQKFVSETTAADQARRFRISRFEREGGTFDSIAASISAIFSVRVEMLKERHRGGPASEARKVFSFIAFKEYRAPLKKIAEYLEVSNTAVSAMARFGREIAKIKKIVI
ncbi:MAG: hypothetical protein PHC61_12975, partial [Chitinivibrionales bacterium]|nr:hypothetical protein [Chitinivibrionales bacterium]